ncbi:PREDICTED: uncharacterized protein LOC104753061 isoform X2 [Camelina sativa]|uniref:Uncharacterized protein LOC104753061 isoform X2 n=1 Tax=Camelina sativa TaxID=90675 RepID=A0ABM0WNF9_CAMSA|nr:PREDICTED: uncharacterized protein LOC104753061 isoform X2 [Camelina sativa]
MMKMIVEMGVYNHKSNEKIMKSVVGFPGYPMPYVDLKEGTLIVIGDGDPVQIVAKLRKKWGKANLTLFVPCEIREVREREALLRSNIEICDRHVPTPHYDHMVNDHKLGCVIC